MRTWVYKLPFCEHSYWFPQSGYFMCTCFLCNSEHSLCIVPVYREVSIHCKLPCLFKRSPNHWSLRSVPITWTHVRAVAKTCYTRTHLSLPTQESCMRRILEELLCRTIIHLGHLLWLPSFNAIFTYPPHWCMHKTFAPYYSWKMLRIQSPFHQDNLGWNQCWAGFKNCTKPLLVVGWFIGVHNCGSQKSKNWFWYLGEPWISTI